MAIREVWFGTQENMAWVPAPLANYSSSNVRWRAANQYLNGGASVRQSAASHTELSLDWGVKSVDALSHVMATLNEPGPYFFVDPIAAKTNVIPSYWATTYLWAEGGPPLVPGIDAEKIAVETQYGYPRFGAAFTVPELRDTGISIPVPPGHVLWLGVRGSGSSLWYLAGRDPQTDDQIEEWQVSYSVTKGVYYTTN